MDGQKYSCEESQQHRIIDFIQQAKLSDFPPEIVEQARYCLLDLLGVAAAGSTTKTAKIISQFASQHMAAGRNQPEVPILFTNVVASPSGAALAGASMIDSIDAHDGFRPAKGHAGCGLLPAILASLMERDGRIDEAELLCCLIVGYEIACRAAMALHTTVSDYHTSGAWVAVAVAAATARIQGATKDELWHALGIAEYHGPRSQMMRVIDYTTMLKDGSGWGALAGITASALAKTGFTGAPALTLASSEVTEIWEDLGRKWFILDQYFKPWAVCRWAQPAMQAVLDILLQMPEQSCDPKTIETINIETFHHALRLATPHPHSPDEAQYSIAWPVAALMYSCFERREFGIYDVSEQALQRQDIHALADRIAIWEKDAFNAVFPQERHGRVSIVLQNGDSYSALSTFTKGDPEAPLHRHELEQKFDQFMQDAGFSNKSEALKRACLHAADGQGFSESVPLEKLIFH